MYPLDPELKLHDANQPSINEAVKLWIGCHLLPYINLKDNVRTPEASQLSNTRHLPRIF